MKKNLMSVVLILITFVVLLFAWWGITSLTQHEYIITVTEKERIQSAGTGKYLIWGDDNNRNAYVFENVDSIIMFKFNSSDVYGKIDVGNTYRIIVVGLRIPFLNMYQNIVSATPLYN